MADDQKVESSEIEVEAAVASVNHDCSGLDHSCSRAALLSAGS